MSTVVNSFVLDVLMARSIVRRARVRPIPIPIPIPIPMTMTMGDGTRPIDARAKATALKAMEDLPRDVREDILGKARADVVVGADRCQNMGCANAGVKRCARC